MPSPAVMSPFVPLSTSACVALPPMLVRFALTAMPVLGGLVPGVTATVSRDCAVIATVDGLAAPTPLGFVALDGVTVRFTGSSRLTGEPEVPLLLTQRYAVYVPAASAAALSVTVVVAEPPSPSALPLLLTDSHDAPHVTVPSIFIA